MAVSITVNVYNLIQVVANTFSLKVLSSRTELPCSYRHIFLDPIATLQYYILEMICDWIWEYPSSMPNYKYLETLILII